jgi:hypothetical protein
MKSRQDLSIDPGIINNAIKAAARETGLTKRVSAHALIRKPNAGIFGDSSLQL